MAIRRETSDNRSMAQLQVPILSTKEFSWTLPTFVAEASSLGNFRPTRLYDDACDVGFALKSQWTGVETRWALSREIRDGENELQGWEFVPTSEALRKYPRFRTYKVVILND